MNVGKQTGATDCGLFALANLTCLVLGLDPVRITYYQQEMREHLVGCFEKRIISPFPIAKTRKTSNIIKKVINIEIFYVACLIIVKK